MSERKTSIAQLEAIKRYQDKNRDYYRKLQRKWVKEHPEKNRENQRRFYARKRLIQAEFKELAAIDCF